MRILWLVLVLAGCTQPPLPPAEPVRGNAGEAPTVSVGGSFRGYYGNTR